jgi:hypothetical protein
LRGCKFVRRTPERFPVRAKRIAAVSPRLRRGFGAGISTKVVDKLVDYRGTAETYSRKGRSGLGAAKISAAFSATKTSAYS